MELAGEFNGFLDHYEFDLAETDSTDLGLGVRARLHESFEFEFAGTTSSSDLIDIRGYTIGARVYLSDLLAISLLSGRSSLSGRLSQDGPDHTGAFKTLAFGLEFHF